MARKCQVCGKGAKKSVSRSHSNIATKRLQKINLQTLIIGGKKRKACAACIRTHSKGKK